MKRFEDITLLRDDGTATYHLASVVDDVDFGITRVIRGAGHPPNEGLHRALTIALGAEPPEYIHYGLVLGPDGRKFSTLELWAVIGALGREGTLRRVDAAL
jgi:glutamyl/glutaminyl-tRNA synthetase